MGLFKNLIWTIVRGPGGSTLHKFGQGCSFKDIFSLPKK